MSGLVKDIGHRIGHKKDLVGRHTVALQQIGQKAADDGKGDIGGRGAILVDIGRVVGVVAIGKDVDAVAHVHPFDPPLFRCQPVMQKPARSEERRVGKECRSRWSPYH